MTASVGSGDDLGRLDNVGVRSDDVVDTVGDKPSGEGLLAFIWGEDILDTPVDAGYDEIWIERASLGDIGSYDCCVDVVDDIAS